MGCGTEPQRGLCCDVNCDAFVSSVMRTDPSAVHVEAGCDLFFSVELRDLFLNSILRYAEHLEALSMVIRGRHPPAVVV